ncbi:hypothetical protein QWY28_06065 [Nocardioides sp. SOB77]|uniref:Uncharacterized protein n=1 Tax=Nocardioides oceani TaxID=3058369 RepID=A0ABT8FCT2_9ACTN|nr:hypothetical protein [Nocardioides oceani]MDN4172501.1 hypothetical protein [Nocardioides oceani]
MTVTVLLLLAVPAVLFGLLLAGLLVLVLTRSRPAPAPPVVAPAPGGGFAPVPSTWNVQVLGPGVIGRMGGTLGSTFGTLALADGTVAFTPDGATAPAWVVPCAQVWVRRQGVGPFAVAALRLHGPMGEVSCNVSREHINRISANSLKDFREAGYAGQFVASAQAHGVRLG